MIILSLDPSYNEFGYTVAEATSGQFKVLEIGTFTIKGKTHKNYKMGVEITKLITQYNPSLIYIEGQFQAKMYEIYGGCLAVIPTTIKYEKLSVKACRNILFKGFKLDKQTIVEASKVRWKYLKGMNTGQIDSFVQAYSQHSNSKVIFPPPVKQKKPSRKKV